MIRGTSLIAVMMVCALLAACAVPFQGALETAAPAQTEKRVAVAAAVSGDSAEPAPTPDPTPAPMPVPEYEARLRALQREIESFVPQYAFEDMDAARLEEYLAQLGGDFVGMGRVCGGEAYVLVERVEPLPEGAYYTSWERSYPDRQYPDLVIELVTPDIQDDEAERPIVYTITNADGLDILENRGRVQAALLLGASKALTHAVSPGSRALTLNARARGFLPSFDRPEGVALALYMYDWALYRAVGHMSPTKYYIPLTADEQALVERALEARVNPARIAPRAEAEAKRHAHDAAFATGFFFEMPGGDDAPTYQMLGDGALCDGWRWKGSTVYESPELAAFFREKVTAALGCDPYSFSMEDFEHITSATFSYPQRIHADANDYNYEFTDSVIDDADKLAALGDILGDGEHLYRGGNGCSFHSFLALTLDDGRVVNVNIATDSCDSALIDGRVGLDDYDKDALFDLFGITPLH